MPFKVVIPARYQASRLPGKVLMDIAGKPMVQHVYERARESGAEEVVVATDDERVMDACASFGGRAMLTRAEHRSGSERLAEVVERDGDSDDRMLVNVQADEPLLPSALIRQTAEALAARTEADVATLSEPIERDEDLFDPSVVKVVRDARGYALYFSRAPIPWYRNHFRDHPGTRPPGARHARHIGIYAYRAGFLRRYVAERPSDTEVAECLEQLRALNMGARVWVEPASVPPGPGVDTPEDLERVRARLKPRGLVESRRRQPARD